ncbi:hypothetical protein TcCL_NonESM12122 [Trypanosoma cruzi]|nr:hypothetical protein TcCL_NonESM12122 [Trypanosoma cruzi]
MAWNLLERWSRLGLRRARSNALLRSSYMQPKPQHRERVRTPSLEYTAIPIYRVIVVKFLPTVTKKARHLGAHTTTAERQKKTNRMTARTRHCTAAHAVANRGKYAGK